MKQVDKE